MNNEYDVFTFSLANFAALSGGSPRAHLMFAGPGGLVFNDSTAKNAGAMMYSTLTITTTADTTTPVPEPTTLLLMAPGLFVGWRARARQR